MKLRNFLNILTGVTVAFVLGSAAAVLLVVLILSSSNELRQGLVESMISVYIDQHPDFHPKVIRSRPGGAVSPAQDSSSSSFKKVPDNYLDDLHNASTAPAVGASSPEVIVVEFFDYACPYCRIAARVHHEILTTEKDRILWIFRDYPILGPTSVTAAKVALASAKQGKYTEFHYELFALSGPLTEEAIFRVAREIGLNIDTLKRDMRSRDISDQITNNIQLATKIGIHGTPTLVVNSTLVRGFVGKDLLLEIISRK